MDNPKKHPLWKKFVVYINRVSPGSLNHGDDWADWWQCFLEGANALLEYQREETKKSEKLSKSF